VVDALDILLAGGEQDSSYAKFRWMVRNHAVDIVQLDVIYSGGLIRTSRVARLAAPTRLPTQQLAANTSTENQTVATACAFCRRNQRQNTRSRSDWIGRKAQRFRRLGCPAAYWLLRLLPPESCFIKPMAIRGAAAEVAPACYVDPVKRLPSRGKLAAKACQGKASSLRS